VARIRLAMPAELDTWVCDAKGGGVLAWSAAPAASLVGELRQVTRLDEATGHQTQILTTRDDPDPAGVARMMFSRWRQKNFFRTMRAHYGLDALDSYAADDDEPERLVTNPARCDADRVLAEARRRPQPAEAKAGRASVGGRRPGKELLTAFSALAKETCGRALEVTAAAPPGPGTSRRSLLASCSTRCSKSSDALQRFPPGPEFRGIRNTKPGAQASPEPKLE